MQMPKVLFVLVLLAAFVGWRYIIKRHAPTTPPVKGDSASLVVDNSSSQRIDCTQIGELARTALADLKIGEGSTLTLYTLGAADNSHEPKLRATVVLEKSYAGTRKALKAVIQACADIETVPSSSIFRAVQVALLQNQGAKGRLYVQSDLGENVDPRLYAYQKKGKDKPAPILINAGVETVMCGTSAASANGPTGEQADALAKVWQRAFVEPDRVRFIPFCPGQKAEQQASAR